MYTRKNVNTKIIYVNACIFVMQFGGHEQQT